VFKFNNKKQTPGSNLFSGSWSLASGFRSLFCDLFETSSQLPEARSEIERLQFYLDKICKNGIKDKFAERRIYKMFGVSYLVFYLAIDVFAALQTTRHHTLNTKHQIQNTKENKR
jgi:hypothetical protein